MMIDLATQTHAVPKGWRPSVPGALADPAGSRRRRSGRTWPFLSRSPQRPAAPDGALPTKARAEGGS